MAPPPNYRQAAAADARKYGVPVNVFLRQIQQESGFNPNAHSGAGADGIAQFIPSTARQYGVNTRDPLSSLDGAARLDADLLKRYGSIARALSAYNSGRPDAYRDPGFAGGQTYNYVRGILGGGSSAPIPGSGGAQVGEASASPAAAAGTPVPRTQLVKALLAASQSGDYAGFFGQVKAQREQPVQASAAAAAMAGPGMRPPGGPLGQVVGGQGENPQFLAALAELAGVEHAPVNINSGYRSYQKQAELYANRASNPNPVAAPGHSLHEQGLAADGTVGGIPLGKLPAALLARLGLETVPGDPVHVQLARGGR